MRRSVEIQVNVDILACLPLLTDRVLKKLEHAGILIVSTNRTATRTTATGVIRVSTAVPKRK